MTKDVDVPFPVRASLRLEGQAQFHPRKYLLGLARAIHGDGGAVFQGVRVLDLTEGSVFRVETTGNGARAARRLGDPRPDHDEGLVLRAGPPPASVCRRRPRARGRPGGMWINVGLPTRSLRTTPLEDGGRLLIVVGEGHRTGHDTDTRRRYDVLGSYLRRHFRNAGIRYRCSTQDAYSVDELPFVGRAGGAESPLLVATGFGGWGMTGGTLAGMLLADMLLGRSSEWLKLYDAGRTALGRSARSRARTRT